MVFSGAVPKKVFKSSAINEFFRFSSSFFNHFADKSFFTRLPEFNVASGQIEIALFIIFVFIFAKQKFAFFIKKQTARNVLYFFHCVEVSEAILSAGVVSGNASQQSSSTMKVEHFPSPSDSPQILPPWAFTLSFAT